MKWVKLSARQPIPKHPVWAKINGDPVVGYYQCYFRPDSFEYFGSDGSDSFVLNSEFDTVEWLDEEETNAD